MQLISFQNFQIVSYADKLTQIPKGYIFNGANVALEFQDAPIEYYRHGWQSWSLAAWLPVDFHLPVQKPEILHPLQIDPLYAEHPAPNGSWLGAVRFENGNVLLLGALGLNSHVALHGNNLHGWYDVPYKEHEAGNGEWFVGYGQENEVFARYAELLGERLGTAPGKPNPRVWCSWYSLYTAIDESLLSQTFDKLGDLPFDVLQVDDGWQISIGDWEANKKFPSGMTALADKIRASGRAPGLWLAPLIAVETSALFRQHSDWFLKDQDDGFVSAGFNWSEPLYALDTTHPDVLEWLEKLMKNVRAWGFDYLKLDFLYAGALPGKRYTDIPRETAYRKGLQIIRDAMGADAYFLTCGAPILPSIGLCDAVRVGPDVAEKWESHRDANLLYNPSTPGTKNAIRTTVNRLWLSPLVATDPDVVYFRSKNVSMNTEQKMVLQNLAEVCNFKATSDLPNWLNTEEHGKLRAFLQHTPQVQRTGRYKFKLDGQVVDFAVALSLPDAPSGLDSILSHVLGWIGNQNWALRILNRLWKRALEKMIKEI